MALKTKGMKKIIILLIILSAPLKFYGQTTSGTLTTDETWTTSVHITGDVTVPNSITLTINPGVTVSFDPQTSLKIEGSGTLIADGTSSNQITFTAFNGTSWGHLYFNNTTASSNSILDNCIIEKGNTSGINPAFGGGVHIKSSNLVISNCIFRNNSGTYGGGIFQDKNTTSSISNCYFNGNNVSQTGGGIYIWANSNATITNCVINNNLANAGGGLFIGEQALNVDVINCTIVNNSASTSAGSIYMVDNNTPSNKPEFLNCIIWGSSSSIIYESQTPQASDFVNCAIQDPVSGSTTSCITLDASNTDPAGPNFTDPATSDYSITVISPCRDAGTNSGAPATDILGNSRINTTDIGAYENIYTRWTGNNSTDWSTSGNWDNGIPGTSLDALVSTTTNNPLISGSDVTLSNLAIETGGIITVGSSRLLTLSNLRNNGFLDFQPATKGTITTIINNGTLKLETDATDVSSLIFTNFSGSDITYELYLTGGNPGDKLFKWHYISSPVTSLSATAFTFKTDNLAQFIESRPSLGLVEGWVAYDGYIYSTGLSGGPTFYTLAPGQGYDYYFTDDWEYTFSGQPNSGSLPTSVTLNYSGTDDNLYGYNLVGNPYSSGIDWDYITANGYPSNTSKALYLTSNNASIVYSNGVSTPDGYSTGIIPPMQGFFIKTYQNNTTFTIPLAARTHSNIHARYKGAAKGSGAIPLIRLSTTENGVTDETVVRFDELAKNGLDYDFDALKLFVSSASTQIYSSLGGVNYAINGQPFPDVSVKIPIVVNLLSTGTHSILASQIQNLDKDSIKLKDTYTGITYDLKKTPEVSFSTGKGTLSDRFILIISDITTGVQDNPVMTGKPFNVYSAFNFINIQTLADEWDGKSGSVNVFDMTGRSILERNNIEFNKNSVTSVPSPASGGLYLVEIRSGIKRYVGKIIIK